MTPKYFGQFLIEKGYVTREQLLEAVELQKEVNLKIGVIALDKKYLTAQAIKSILETQKTINKPFGEIAVDKGLISAEQLAELLTIQRADRIMLGEALVEKNFLSLEELERMLNEYHEDEKRAEKELENSFQGLPDSHTALIQDGTQIIISMLTRLLDQSGKICGCYKSLAPVEDRDIYLFYQTLSGDLNCLIGLALKKDTILSIAGKMLNRPFHSINELSLDVCQEFVNIITGHICTNLSSKGLLCEAAPPANQVLCNCQVHENFKSTYLIPIKTTDDSFEIHFYISS